MDRLDASDPIIDARNPTQGRIVVVRLVMKEHCTLTTDVRRRRLNKARRAPAPARAWMVIGPISVFLVVALLSTLVFGALRGRERHQKRQDFIVQAQQLAFAIERQFDVPLELLRAVAALFISSETVSRDEFATFVQPIIARHPSIYAFEWMPLVTDGERDSLVRAVRAEGFPSFHFQQKDPAGQLVRAERRAEYLPILYMEPLEAVILGLDVIGNPERGDESLRARRTGHATASDRYSLVEDPDDVYSVIGYEPVAKRLPGGTEEQLIGLVGVLLRLDPVVREAISGGGTEGIHLLLCDESAPEEKRVLFESPSGVVDLDADAALATAFDFADRKWSVRLTPLPNSTWALGHGPVAFWVAGLLLGILAAFGSGALLQIGALRRRVDEAMELGQYRLGERLGEGGMGVVYRAEHRMLARQAAIKLIHPPEGGSPGGTGHGQLLERFEREARATAALRSPHTVQVYDFGRTDDGDFYYVMELLDGLDLETLVERDGPVEPSRVVHFLLQICHSLAEAHAAGLVHRDIKPANIYLCRQGLDVDVLKVMDFGLVRERRAPTTENPKHTRSDVLLGTPAFCAPEVASQEADIDARADLYSLGCVAYWLLTGKLLFERDTAVAMFLAHISEPPPEPSTRTDLEIPEDLERVVMHCLAKEPANRPSSARALDALLRKCACSGEWTHLRAAAWWAERPERLPAGSQEHEERDHRA